MKKEVEEKVQGIGSGVVGNWTLGRRDATRPNLKPFVCLYLFITRRVVDWLIVSYVSYNGHIQALFLTGRALYHYGVCTSQHQNGHRARV
jgi:hypothetical protein